MNPCKPLPRASVLGPGGQRQTQRDPQSLVGLTASRRLPAPKSVLHSTQCCAKAILEYLILLELSQSCLDQPWRGGGASCLRRQELMLEASWRSRERRGHRLTEEQGRDTWSEVTEAERQLRPSVPSATMPPPPHSPVGRGTLSLPGQYPFGPTVTSTPLHPNSHPPGTLGSGLQSGASGGSRVSQRGVSARAPAGLGPALCPALHTTSQRYSFPSAEIQGASSMHRK